MSLLMPVFLSVLYLFCIFLCLFCVCFVSGLCLFCSFTLHVQLGLGWDVFQNGWDGSQPLRRFLSPPSPPPPLTYFLHIKLSVPKRKKSHILPGFFLEDVPKGCKVSDIQTDIHVHIVLEFCAKNSQ